MSPSSQSVSHRCIVKPNAVAAIISGHPWLMADSILRIESVQQPEVPPATLGSHVMILTSEGKTLARGLYNPNSKIAVRIYSRDARQPLDSEFIKNRINKSLRLRQRVGSFQTHSASRMISSEGDSLSGLIVDSFASHLVVHQTAGAMSQFKEIIIHQLGDALQPTSITWTVDEATSKLEGIEASTEVVYGSLPETLLEIEENGLYWQVDLRRGQKTGYYLDQVENRRAVVRWLKPGYIHPGYVHGEKLEESESVSLKILDVCCYQGGFALTLAKQFPSAEVLAIDSSEYALSVAENNARRNKIANVQFLRGDFLGTLNRLILPNVDESSTSLGNYDCVILDPPKLAGSRDSIDRALRAYHRLNLMAVKLLKPEGVLVTCSCSGRISHEDFQWMLRGVSRNARRSIQILERRGPASDHPINVSCPESDYLKCYICRIGETESSPS